MQATIHYAGINQEISSTKGNSILEASISNKITHLHECGGHGKCTTCRVRIIDGVQNVSPKTLKEKQMAKLRKWDPSVRLACQCYINGDVSIQRLIWSSGEVNRLQAEVAPEGKAEERAVAILFCDIRNYTNISSNNASFDIAYMLNQFYTALSDPILMNNGIIYQYVGDEIVGVFGTTGGTSEKNCMDAIRAAKGMQYALDRLNKIQLKDFDFKLEIGIGVNFGRAYVGHLGHPTHRMFSVIGDPVNVASRIQGQTKKLGAPLLISDSTLRFLPTTILDLGRTFDAQLNGKPTTVKIHELNGFQEMDIQLEVQASLHLLLKNEEHFAQVFYEKLFEKAPFVRQLFQTSMLEQGRLLTHMLGGIVYAISRPEYLILGLKKLGESHYGYGVREEYYPLVKETMLETIPEVLGEHYHPKIGEAWGTALDFIVEHMKTWREN
ncbi:MAG: adenylate/guanylate cyclase domain-containing protein [Bacteroidota bacterium]